MISFLGGKFLPFCLLNRAKRARGSEGPQKLVLLHDIFANNTDTGLEYFPIYFGIVYGRIVTDKNLQCRYLKRRVDHLLFCTYNYLVNWQEEHRGKAVPTKAQKQL